MHSHIIDMMLQHKLWRISRKTTQRCCAALRIGDEILMFTKVFSGKICTFKNSIHHVVPLEYIL